MTAFDIDRSAPAIGRATLRIQAPVKDVWAILSNLDDWPLWNPDVGRIAVLGEPAPGTHFEWTAGGLFIRSRIQLFDAPFTIGWTGEGPLISARHIYRLKDIGGVATQVETEESFTGLFPRLLPWLARRSIDRALQRGLLALQSAVEAPPRRSVRRRAA